MFAGNLFISSGSGILFGFLVALEDIFTFNASIGYWFTWLSPATMSRLVMLDRTRTFLYPSVAEALAVINSLSVILIAFIMIRGHKKAI